MAESSVKEKLCPIIIGKYRKRRVCGRLMEQEEPLCRLHTRIHRNKAEQKAREEEVFELRWPQLKPNSMVKITWTQGACYEGVGKFGFARVRNDEYELLLRSKPRGGTIRANLVLNKVLYLGEKSSPTHHYYSVAPGEASLFEIELMSNGEILFSKETNKDINRDIVIPEYVKSRGKWYLYDSSQPPREFCDYCD